MIVLLLLYLSGMFLLVNIKQDNSLGNFTWGGGVLLVTWDTFLQGSWAPRSVLITSLVTLWALRLGIYFYSRYKKGADPRFLAWQKQWKHPLLALLISLIWIFGAQGPLLLIMASPAWVVNMSSLGGLTWLDLVGTTGWLIGFYWEAVGDYQLAQFLRDPKNRGKIMDQGLWRYSRHPNYFGEIVMWWSLFLISISVPDGLISIIAPITITLLLRFITGVPMVERVFQDNPLYQEYAKRTSTLIPWWPRK